MPERNSYRCVGGPMDGTYMRTVNAYEVNTGFEVTAPGRLDGMTYIMEEDGFLHYVEPSSGAKLQKVTPPAGD